MHIIYDDFYLKHDTGQSHVENPGRLAAIVEALERGNYGSRLNFLKPKAAKNEDIALVHTEQYIKYIMGLPVKDSCYYYLDRDTVASKYTYSCAVLAAGGCITGIDYLFRDDGNGPKDFNDKKDIKGRKSFFALIRPPGHHAFSSSGSGFCIFNNIAIAARYALKKKIISKIAIVDFDVHHGNGTQEIFYNDNKVLYISLHQYPHYPGTGDFTQAGEGPGKGFTLNIMMQAGSGEHEYLEAFKEIILPRISEFVPELVLISAGYDAHRLDPLSSINLDSSSYRKMMDMLLCGVTKDIPFGMVLEGGYHPPATAESALSTIDAFLEEENVLSFK